jgi:hypothetical protein
MTEPNPFELVEQLRTATTVPEMARVTAALLRACGVFNHQGIGQELARLSVTADRDGFRKQ